MVWISALPSSGLAEGLLNFNSAVTYDQFSIPVELDDGELSVLLNEYTPLLNIFVIDGLANELAIKVADLLSVFYFHWQPLSHSAVELINLHICRFIPGILVYSLMLC